MFNSDKDVERSCFNIAYRDALLNVNGEFFRPWQGLSSLVEASSYIKGLNTPVADHQRNSVLKLTFDVLFTMGHRDLAYRVLEELEEDIDRQEGLLLEMIIEDADYICRRLLNMHMAAEANRVASKYIQRIEKRLASSFDPMLDETLLKDILERLMKVKKRAAVASLTYEDTRKKVEAIISQKLLDEMDVSVGNQDAFGEV